MISAQIRAQVAKIHSGSASSRNILIGSVQGAVATWSGDQHAICPNDFDSHGLTRSLPLPELTDRNAITYPCLCR